MFEKLVTASEAMGRARPALMPALEGCPDCGTVRMVAAPALDACPGCGKGHMLLDGLPARVPG